MATLRYEWLLVKFDFIKNLGDELYLIFNLYDFQECIEAPINTKTYTDNMIVGIAFLLGFLVQGALINPLGRKNVLMAALAIGIISGVLLHIVTNSVIVLLLFCLYILMPGLSISNMCSAVVDLVPTHLRYFKLH